MELRLWPRDASFASASVTAVRAPAGLTDAAIRARLRERYGVMISPSSGYFGEEIFRMAHMGKVAHPTYLCAQVAMIERTLADLGHGLTLGAGVGAALDVLAAWPPA
jgi:pyridoxamine--pyruvate transaminase